MGRFTHFCMNHTDNHKIQREQERDREEKENPKLSETESKKKIYKQYMILTVAQSYLTLFHKSSQVLKGKPIFKIIL